MNPLTLDAPAKLNLALRILGKRADGFHDLDTLMVKLPQLADRLHFTPAADFRFTCDDPTLPTDEGNLVVQAVRAYEAAANVTCNCHVALEKRIPHQAGLGGGSSDAAATLRGLDQLHGDLLGAGKLAQLAATLGSDVPFFLTPGAARCTGRGELIEPVPAPPALPVLLVKPAFGVATPAAYAAWETAVPIPGIDYAPQTISGVTLVNDLECPVFQKYRFLAELKQWLTSRGEVAGALLCGSGSTVFAVLHDPQGAQPLTAAARLELDPGLWTWSGTTGSDET
jgi:4-diphosphocytidyl-2-C-methyl-D-erythritol kinase